MLTYDAIVIGAGQNGLTTACYLARAGMKVLVLEAYSAIGGMTLTEEITLPGFHTDIHASGYQLANFSPVVNELNLESYGLKIIKSEYPFSHAFENGEAIHVHCDIDKTIQNIARYSLHDSQQWRRFMTKYQEERSAIIDAFFSPPTPLAKQITHFSASSSGWEAYRFNMLSVRSWVDQTFESDEVKALFASFASFLGTSPDDPCGAQLAWLFAAILQIEGNNIVQGGMNQLTIALAKDLEAHGGEIKTKARVTKIEVDKGRAKTVVLENGEKFQIGKILVSSIDPAQLFLKLLDESAVGKIIHEKVDHYEWGDSVFVIYIALKQPIQYRAGEAAQQSAHVHLMPASLAALSQVYTDCRGGKLPDHPLIVSWNDANIDPSRVPQNASQLKLVVLNVPYKPNNNLRWEDQKLVYAEHLINLIQKYYIPDLKENILKYVVHSPVDIENKIITAVKGTLGQGAFFPYQHGALRPIPELGQYKTTLENLYLCGSSSHPGPGVSMAPGYNAAGVIANDLALTW